MAVVATFVEPSSWTLFSGIYGVVKQANLYDSSPTPQVVNLTGRTVTLLIWAGDPTAPVIDEAITVSNALTGQVQWTVSQADIALLDVNLTGYHGQFNVSSSGYLSKSYPITVIVRRAA